jgi:intein/homing endonuclease
MPVIISCKICGKKFAVRPARTRIGKRQAKYCSRKCQAKAYKVIPEKKKCLRCGKIFLVGGAKRKRRNQRFCSRACCQAGEIKPRNMTKGERMWLAGLFDGEGSIIFYKSLSKHDCIRISITNTVKELMDKVQEIIGIGNIYARPIPENPKHNRCWHWQCHGGNARIILRQILPWLIVKKEKATKVLANR